jgi:hypothetical protein
MQRNHDIVANFQTVLALAIRRLQPEQRFIVWMNTETAKLCLYELEDTTGELMRLFEATAQDGNLTCLLGCLVRIDENFSPGVIAFSSYDAEFTGEYLREMNSQGLQSQIGHVVLWLG